MISDNQSYASPFVTGQYHKQRPKRLLQNHDNLLSHIQLTLSIFASVLTLLCAAWLRNNEINDHYRALALISGLLIMVIYGWRGVYRRSGGRLNGALRIARSWSLVVLSVVLAMFACKLSDTFSRVVIVSWAIGGYLLQLVAYQVTYSLSRHADYGQPVRAIVLGTQGLAEHLIDSLRKNAWMPDRIIGVLDDDPSAIARWKTEKAAYLGSIEQLRKIITEYKINRVYIALPISRAALIDEICEDLGDVPLDVVWVPDIYALRLLNHSIREINGLPLISLSESPLTSASGALTKSIMDKSIAMLMLIALSPLMALIALLVRTSSPGPIIFKQKRHGWDGRIIDVWKFRSMVMHNDADVRQATKNDNRITPIGKFIRRTSLDELPQLFNVLQGTMSLVGPRPHAVEHNDLYSCKIRSYMQRHRTKPGMTGWAQVNGLRGETDTMEKMYLRVEMDLDYINRWSIWLDIKILLKTPFALLFHDAY